MSIPLKNLKKLPDAPGVYFFLGKRKNLKASPNPRLSTLHAPQGLALWLVIHSREVLYIGKAGSLRDRVRSYFSRDIAETRGAGIKRMVEMAKDITYEKTDSVLEAVLLEAELIKKYQPKYNVREKDDKSFNYVVITAEDFPRVLLIRGRELSLKPNTYNLKTSFGPFPHGSTLREALSIIRKIFPYRDKCKPATEQGPSLPKVIYPQASVDKLGQGRALRIKRGCFNRQIGLCPGVCTCEISKEEYAKTIRNMTLLFQGKKKELLKKLSSEMKTEAEAQKFERAAKIRNTIFALKHIQDVSLLKRDTYAKEHEYQHIETRIKRIEAYDVAHTSGKEIVGVMVTLYGGEPDKNAYRKFKLRTVSSSNDTAASKEVLERRLAHAEWPFSDLVVVDGGKAQINIAMRVLKESGLETPVVGVTKDERHRPKNVLGDAELRKKYENEILLANSEAHRFAIGYHRRRMRKR